MRKTWVIGTLVYVVVAYVLGIAVASDDHGHSAAPPQVVEEWECPAPIAVFGTPVESSTTRIFDSSVLTPDIVSVGEFHRLAARVASLERSRFVP
jgi:heme A synthase